MTFQQALDRIQVAVDRDDLVSSYPDFLNRALREAALRHSFDQMKTKFLATIAIGSNGFILPEDFKEFQNGRFPISASIGGAPNVQVPVYARSELEQLIAIFRPASYFTFVQDVSPGPNVFLPALLTVAWDITLFYFAFPLVYTDYTMTPPLLDRYPNMILSKALSLIFQSISDPVYETHEDQFNKEIQMFTGEDILVSKPNPRPDKE